MKLQHALPQECAARSTAQHRIGTHLRIELAHGELVAGGDRDGEGVPGCNAVVRDDLVDVRGKNSWRSAGLGKRS